MNSSAETKEIDTALAKAQGQFNLASKDSLNPHWRQNYADLASIVQATRPMLSQNGLAIIQGLRRCETSWVLVTKMVHCSGQWYETEFPITPKDMSPQSLGSAMTYAKRYAYAAITGAIAGDEDDDGEAAQGRSIARSTTLTHNSGNREGTMAANHSTASSWSLTDKQLARLFAIATSAGYDSNEMKDLMKSKYKIESSKDLSKTQYEEICAFIENNPKQK